jgi:hypothetical protein
VRIGAKAECARAHGLFDALRLLRIDQGALPVAMPSQLGYDLRSRRDFRTTGCCLTYAMP